MSKPDEVDTVQESLGNIQLEIENDVKSNQVFDADAMTQEQKDKVKSFRDQVAELKLDAKDLPDESAAIRFVSTNSFDVAAALEQYRAYLQWRKDHNVDSIATKELYQEDFLKALIPYSLHGFTKKGNPIYLEKTGKVHTWAAPQVDLDQFTWFHVRGVEQMLAKLKESSARHGRPIEKVSSIIDLAGLGLSHRNAISLLSTASALDAKYYPGLIGDIYVLNTPFVIPGLWEMVKMILPMSTITKIHILGSDYKERLLEHIDADQLPEEYGGTCKCPGGCIKEATEAEVKQVLLKDRSGLKLTEKSVLAGEKFEVKLDGKTGDEFLWSFDVSDNYDIGFSITMVQKDNPNAVVNVKMDSRCVTNKGSYNATKDCTLTFVWDNSYSYWNSKNLKYHCSVKSN